MKPIKTRCTQCDKSITFFKKRPHHNDPLCSACMNKHYKIKVIISAGIYAVVNQDLVWDDSPIMTSKELCRRIRLGEITPGTLIEATRRYNQEDYEYGFIYSVTKHVDVNLEQWTLKIVARTDEEARRLKCPFQKSKPLRSLSTVSAELATT